MQEKSAFDILIENLIDLGLDPESNRTDKTFFMSTSDRALSVKYVGCQLSDSIYFFAVDYYGTRVGSSSTFTGIYSTVDLPQKAEYKVMKRDWFDFLYTKRRKTGIGYVDKRVTIISSGYIPKRELSRENIELFLSIYKRVPYYLIVENNYLPRLTVLKNKKVIGLEIGSWIYQKEDLKDLISRGKDLIENIKTPGHNGGFY